MCFGVFLILIAHRRNFIRVWLNHKVFKIGTVELPGWGGPENEMWAVKGLGVSGNRKRKAGMTRLGWDVLFVSQFLVAGKSKLCISELQFEGEAQTRWQGVSRKELKKVFLLVKSDLKGSATNLPEILGSRVLPDMLQFHQLRVARAPAVPLTRCVSSCLCFAHPSLFAEGVHNG